MNTKIYYNTNNTQVILITCVLFLICSCRNKSDIEGANYNLNFETKFSVTDTSSWIVLDKDSIFSGNYKKIPLVASSSHDDGLISNVKGVYYIDGKWLIYDSSVSDSKLLLYSEDGSFIRQLSSKGKAAGEYSRINLVRINDDKKRIEAFDVLQKKIICFDFNGDFVSTKRTNFMFSDFVYEPSLDHYFFFTHDYNNRYLFKNYPLKKDFAIVETDSLFRPLRGYVPINVHLSASSFVNNGKVFFDYNGKRGFLDRYGANLYYMDSLEMPFMKLNFRNGIEFQEDDYFRKEAFARFMNTLKNGKSMVYDFNFVDEIILFDVLVTVSMNGDPITKELYIIYDLNSGRSILFNDIRIEKNHGLLLLNKLNRDISINGKTYNFIMVREGGESVNYNPVLYLLSMKD